MLTDAQVRRIKPLEKKKRYSDEKGLYLEVTPSGGRFWRLKYRFNGRESTLTIGSYPETSLAQARRTRDEARVQLYKNIDPNAVKNSRLQDADENKLFKVLAMEWMKDRKAVIKEATYLRDLSVFEKDIFPALGNMPIDQIKGKDVLACAKKIEARGAQEMAKRSIPLTGRIFRFAIRKGLIENDPTPHLHEALKPRKVKHMARLDISEFPPFLERMDRYHGNPVIKTALQLMTLTFVRTAELRLMEWSEIDFENKLWRIPAEKMKMALPHLVPLSTQAIELLKNLLPLTGRKQYVFYNHSTAKPMSSNAAPFPCPDTAPGTLGSAAFSPRLGCHPCPVHERARRRDRPLPTSLTPYCPRSCSWPARPAGLGYWTAPAASPPDRCGSSTPYTVRLAQ